MKLASKHHQQKGVQHLLNQEKQKNKKLLCTEVVTCWRSTGLTVGEMATVREASMFLVSARGWSMARLGMWA